MKTEIININREISTKLRAAQRYAAEAQLFSDLIEAEYAHADIFEAEQRLMDVIEAFKGDHYAYWDAVARTKTLVLNSEVNLPQDMFDALIEEPGIEVHHNAAVLRHSELIVDSFIKVRLDVSLSAKMPEDTREILRGIGKIVTSTSEYTSLVC